MLIYPINFLQKSTSFDFGNALFFDATNDLVQIPVQSQNEFGTGDFTILFWVYCPSYGSSKNLLTYYVNNNRLWNIQLVTYFPGGVGQKISAIHYWLESSTNTPNPATVNNSNNPWGEINQWNLFGIRRESGNIRVLANGLMGASNAYNHDLNLGASNYFLNQHVQASNRRGTRHQHYQDSSMWFNRAITSPEFTTLYNKGKGSDPRGMSGLVAYYQYDSPAGTASDANPANRILLDSTSYANNGIITGYSSGNKDFVNHTKLI